VVTATSTVQAIMVFAGMMLATVAPEVAKPLDIPPSLICYQFSHDLRQRDFHLAVRRHIQADGVALAGTLH
jgi:hypothetical protein